MNPVVRGDIIVSAFLDSVGGYRHKERRDVLLDILDIDLDWHMHTISDGERRRVQLCMGLMSPWDVLLLDEVLYLEIHLFFLTLLSGHRRPRCACP
jgi:CCR4-NOT complex subunit CAF16